MHVYEIRFFTLDGHTGPRPERRLFATSELARVAADQFAHDQFGAAYIEEWRAGLADEPWTLRIKPAVPHSGNQHYRDSLHVRRVTVEEEPV